MMRVAFIVMGVFCVAAFSGCASNGAREAVVAAPAPIDEREERLREIVAEEVERERRNQGEGSSRLMFSKPLYYKEYWVLPSEDAVFSADFTQKESLTTPLTAEVEVEKTRFATRARRDRGEARADEDYLRSIGIEQASYELRHGRWRRVGSLFLAQRTEELRDGEWVQVEEQRPIYLIDEEEPGGFLGRFRFWR